MDDEADTWTYGTVLRNPGCDFVVMYVSPHPDTSGLDYFYATVLHDGVKREPLFGKDVITCGGKPSDPISNRWVILDD